VVRKWYTCVTLSALTTHLFFLVCFHFFFIVYCCFTEGFKERLPALVHDLFTFLSKVIKMLIIV
jgi:hypothetical protein